MATLLTADRTGGKKQQTHQIRFLRFIEIFICQLCSRSSNLQQLCMTFVQALEKSMGQRPLANQSRSFNLFAEQDAEQDGRDLLNQHN